MFNQLYKKIVEEEEMDIFKASTPEEGLRRREEFLKIWIKEMVDSGKARINLDGSYDVDGDVNYHNHNLTRIPFKFNNVSGYFDCSFNKLTSLEGVPRKVGRGLNCAFNKLTTLEGAPKEVGGYFYCDNNKLTSLIGCPISVGKSFYCSYNNLTSLEGCPKEVGGSFYCNNNKTKFNISDVQKESDVNDEIHI